MAKPVHARYARIACLATLSAATALPSAAGAASPDAAVVLARAAVPDEELAPMRGGLDLGSMIARFAIERVVRVDGEVVARTQLMLDRLDGLTRGRLPDARLVGNLANLVQVGDGNGTTTMPSPSAPASPPPSGQAVSSGTVSTPNSTDGMANDWASMFAQAVALANGDESNRPTPVNVGTVPTGNPNPAVSNPSSPPSQAPGSGAGSPTAGGVPVVQPVTPVAPIAVPTMSITIPVGSGRSVVVSGIPNGPALATSIQNSVQAATIAAETRIELDVSSLSALRSLNFAAQLRQQAIDAARR